MKELVSKSDVERIVRQLGADIEACQTSGRYHTFLKAMEEQDRLYRQSNGATFPRGPWSTMSADAEVLYKPLVKVVSRWDIAFSPEKLNCWNSGYFDHRAHTLGVNERLTNAERVPIIIHELAHSILHRGIPNIGSRVIFMEIEAETTAYTVLKSLGYEYGGSALYLGDYVERVTTIDGAIPAVYRATTLILDALHTCWKEVPYGQRSAA